jgi:ABC-type amino acid transport substrate-binding protein
MIRRVLPLALAGLMSFSAEARAPLEIGVVENSFNSEMSGRVLTQLYREIGIEVKLVRMPSARNTHELANGGLDGEVQRIASYGDNRPAMIRVDPAIYVWTTAAFYKKNKNIKVDSFDEVKNYYFGYVRGYKVMQDMFSGAPKGNAITTSEQLVMMLQHDRLEVIVDSADDAHLNFSKHGLKDVVQTDLQLLPLFHFLHMRNKDVMPQISALISKKSQSGELAKMFEKTRSDLLASGLFQ